MSHFDNTFEASWKGAFFFPNTTTTEGGHDDVVKKIVSSPRAIIEQLGLKSPVFTIGGTIASRRSRDNQILISYEVARDQLIEALDSPGPGILVHPFTGRLQNIVLRTYSLTQSLDSLGTASISMTFGRTDEQKVPVIEGASVPKIESLTFATGDVAQRSLEENHVVTLSNTGNFQAASDKISDFIDSVNDAFDGVNVVTDQLQEVQTVLSELSRDITTLVQTPVALADRIRGVYNSLRGIGASVIGTYETFKALFDFGDSDTPSAITTTGRTERELNRTTFNNMAQSIALAEAYEAAANIDFQTVEEIEAQAAILDAVYDKLQNRSTIDSDTILALSSVRIEVSKLFARKKLTAQRIQTVDVVRGGPRLIAFRYYGDFDNVDLLVELNSLQSGDPIEGNIRMLTA